MANLVMTEKERENLIDERDSLEYKLKRSNSNDFRYFMRFSEVTETEHRIAEIDHIISNAVIVPSIKLNNKFTVEEDGISLDMIISVNPIEIEGVTCCTCNSEVGRALLDKKVGDNISVGGRTYIVVSIT